MSQFHKLNINTDTSEPAESGMKTNAALQHSPSI